MGLTHGLISRGSDDRKRWRTSGTRNAWQRIEAGRRNAGMPASYTSVFRNRRDGGIRRCHPVPRCGSDSMTVCELIERLMTFAPDKPVFLADWQEQFQRPAPCN